MDRKEFRAFSKYLTRYFGCYIHPRIDQDARRDIEQTKVHDARLAVLLQALHDAQVNLAQYLVARTENGNSGTDRSMYYT